MFNIGTVFQNPSAPQSYYIPPAQVSNDLFSFGTIAFNALGRPGAWRVNSFAMSSTMLTRTNVPVRFIVSGDYWGFGVPVGTVPPGWGGRWYDFLGDQQNGLGTHDWSLTYTPGNKSFYRLSLNQSF